MRKLASVAIIDKSEEIKNSDRLSCVTMAGKGWRVVTGRDEFKPGDKVVYFEIDSALPIDDKRYSFLIDKCRKCWCNKHGKVVKETLRIKTIKLRGVISQGLAMPICLFPEIDKDAEAGTDLTETLNIRHYDDIDIEMRQYFNTSTPAGTGRPSGTFPHYIPKTDEERIQNLADWVTELKGTYWEVTEKNDGSSCTMFWSPTMSPDEPFGVCSRNYRLKNEEGSAWWDAAIKYDIENKLKTLGMELAIQGELVGPGINGNRDKYTEREFHAFRIWDIKRQEWISSARRTMLCKTLDIPHVKVIDAYFPVFDNFNSVDEILQFAEGKTERGNEREGLVFKETCTATPRSFKAVSNKYLLNEK